MKNKSKDPAPAAPAKLTITISKTSDGLRDYVQVMSSDMVSVNVVLIADQIVLEDRRQ